MKIALGAVSFVLLVSLATNSYLYFSLSNSINNNNDLHSQIGDLVGQRFSLQEQIRSLQDIIAGLQNENADLKNLLDLRNIPNLVTSLGVRDVHLPPHINPTTNYRLYIEGTVFNIGSETAYNCRLHVTLYRGESIVVDTNVGLGTIAGGASVQVSKNISYSGDALTNWTIIPEFD